MLNPINVEKARAYLSDIWPKLVTFSISDPESQLKIAKENGWTIVYDDAVFYAQSIETIRVSCYEPEKLLCFPSMIEGVQKYGSPDNWIQAILAASHESAGASSTVNPDRENWALATSVPGLISILLAK